MLKYFLVISFFSIVLNSYAQDEDLAAMRAHTLKNLGRNADRLHDTYSAIRYYSAYLEKHSNDLKAIQRLAQLEESARYYAEAKKHFALLDEKNSSQFEMALYDKARMMKMEGDYAAAKLEFKRFMDRYGKKIDKELKKLVLQELNGCDTALMWMNKPINVKIENMGDEVNHSHIEFSPLPTGENTLIFGSYPPDDKTYYDVLEETPKRKFYNAHKDGERWVLDGVMEGPINFPDAHSGNGTFSPDGKRFYFTKCKENWKFEVECEIWVCSKNSSGWQTPVLLGKEVNMPGYTSTHPTVGFDTKHRKEILYFSSNRPEGYGENDIWFVVYDPKKNVYGEAKNAGKNLNTPRNELTPFYFEKERKLYFSTDGRSGLGGLDIYSARGEMRTWGPSSNVGYPINTSVDELYYALKPSGESGYFVSNRSGGHNVLQSTCCDDLYEFEKTNPVFLAVSGSVAQMSGNDYINGKGDELLTPITDDMQLSESSIDVYILEGNQEILMKSMTTDSQGKFFMDLEENKGYKLVIGKEGYLNNIVEFNTYANNKSDTLIRNVGLAPILSGSIIIENIEYEFDSAQLTEEARRRIDNALLNVLIENPEIKVEIGSHTDSRGSDEYNQKLSQQRAQTVVSYLTSKKIDENRLIARGYGETQPIAPNQLADGSDNEAGRQKNRRTEFRIVGRINVVVKTDD
jgi:OOP family OmpA-OmpF porin